MIISIVHGPKTGVVTVVVVLVSTTCTSEQRALKLSTSNDILEGRAEPLFQRSARRVYT